MKNGSTFEQLKLQKKIFQYSKGERNQDSNKENIFSINLENEKTSSLDLNADTHAIANLEKYQISGLSISFISSGTNLNVYSEKEIQKRRRKKKKGRNL